MEEWKQDNSILDDYLAKKDVEYYGSDPIKGAETRYKYLKYLS